LNALVHSANNPPEKTKQVAQYHWYTMIHLVNMLSVGEFFNLKALQEKVRISPEKSNTIQEKT